MGAAELLQAHLLLVVTGVNGDGPQTHGLCVLLCNGTETTSSADNGDGLAGPGARLLKALVDGDTGAENWCNGLEVNVLVDARDVGGLGDAVFLEGTVDGVSGEEGVGAEGLVGGLAEVASKAGSVDPLWREFGQSAVVFLALDIA